MWDPFELVFSVGKFFSHQTGSGGFVVSIGFKRVQRRRTLSTSLLADQATAAHEHDLAGPKRPVDLRHDDRVHGHLIFGFVELVEQRASPGAVAL